MEPDREAICGVFRNAAALEVLSALLEDTEDDMPAASVLGIGHLCHLLHDDLERVAEKLSG